MDHTSQLQIMYIAGGPNGNSISPPIHDSIARSLNLNWTCEFLRLSDIKDVMTLFHRSDFAGGIVTMPHKLSIIPLLDSIDQYVEDIGACNLVARRADGKLHGTNTDWLGIKGAIEESGSTVLMESQAALVYGAGGACRAAVYALAAGFGCKVIYIVNRDEQEVAALMADVSAYKTTESPHLIHVKSMDQAKTLSCPGCIISTVPDFEPSSSSEISCRAVLEYFLEIGRGQGRVLLDMCYHPLITRNIKAGVETSWIVIEGYHVVSHQFALQWDFLTGRSIDQENVFALCNRLVKERGVTHMATGR